MKQLTANNYEIIRFDDATNVRFYTSVDPGSYVAPHWHDAIEIVLLKKGELFYTTEEHTIKMSEGSFILTSPNVVHSTHCGKPNTAIVFQIPLSYLEKYIPNVRYMKFQIDSENKDPMLQTKIDLFKATIEKMQILMDEPIEGSKLRFNSLLFDALFQLTHNFSILQSESTIATRDKNLHKLKEVLYYIEEHYNEPISLADVSALAMYEPKYFCRFFKNNMGTTFLEYQNMLRIARIYEDLQNTEDPIHEILERHGFTNYKVFRRMFYEQFEATPSQIRERKKILS